MEMPIIRKIIDVGKTSRGVILPKSWFVYFEKHEGIKLQSVAIEVNRVLKISPLPLKEPTEAKPCQK